MVEIDEQEETLEHETHSGRFYKVSVRIDPPSSSVVPNTTLRCNPTRVEGRAFPAMRKWVVLFSFLSVVGWTYFFAFRQTPLMSLVSPISPSMWSYCDEESSHLAPFRAHQNIP